MDIRWYFDFISPFAWLQFARVRELSKELAIEPVPVLLAALLAHHGNLGPAEIPAKRGFTYRFALWQAEQSGLTLKFPPTHPFNPLPALRLAIAAECRWDAIGSIFAHIWQSGLPAEPVDLVPLAERLDVRDPARAITRRQVKQGLQDNTASALRAGVFGVPTLLANGELFWGNDATGMFEAWLDSPDHFQRNEYARLRTLPIGVERSR